MKKLLITLSALSLLTGCATTSTTTQTSTNKMQIVTTIFPEYDWVKQITAGMEDYVDVTFLVDDGTDLHSYQPSASDVLKMSTADIVVYVGGESDEWVAEVLEQSVNTDQSAVSLMGLLGDAVKEEEHVEGMQEEEHDHDHEDHDEDHEHEEEDEYDEHVWLSIRNAITFVHAFTQVIAEKDPAHKNTYQANAKAYVEQLAALDETYTTTLAACNSNTLLFADRFPFRYLTDDYNLNYYAAFAGCSTETAASFSTIAFLAEKTDELNLEYVLTIDHSDQSVAQAVVSSTSSQKQLIETLDSMQSTTLKDYESGVSYISVMEKNLEVLKKVLG